MALRVCWRGGPHDGRLGELDVADPPEVLDGDLVPDGGGRYRLGPWDELNRCWHYHLVDGAAQPS